MDKQLRLWTPEWYAWWSTERPLAARDAEIVRLYAAGGETLKSLGEQYGISQETVRRIVVRGRYVEKWLQWRQKP